MSLRHPAGSGAILWFSQRLTGVVLVLLLGLHFAIQHFLDTPSSGVLDYATVTSRFANPWYKTLDLVFVVLALAHGLNGVWMVTEDFFHKPWQRLVIWSTLATVGVALFALAVVTVLPLVGKA
jgi:succinate dehydrogenase / fumarate reductase membrane anchor subunit